MLTTRSLRTFKLTLSLGLSARERSLVPSLDTALSCAHLRSTKRSLNGSLIYPRAAPMSVKSS